MDGPLYRFFAADHRRLDALLKMSTAKPGAFDVRPFRDFRAGLLRHIGREEKLLFPALREALGGARLPILAKLRVDHGALAALLVPTPTPVIIEDLRSILVRHNQREEAPEGVYDLADCALSPDETKAMLERVRAFPKVPVRPHNDGPEVMEHVAATVALARVQWLKAHKRRRG